MTDYTDFVHTGPDTLGGRYMRLFWQPVGLSSDLPPGKSVPIRVMSEDFTLYRGQTGKVHLLDFRCAHRGTQLSTGWVEEDCIRCFYHGWKYDATGQCVEQPAEDAAFAAKIRIGSYPAQEYLGVIFGYFGPGVPPPLPRYPHMESGGVMNLSKYVRPFNFFQNVENSVDLVHLGIVHRSSEVGDSGLADLRKMSAEESPWGITATAPGSNGAARIDQFGMPNIINFTRQPEDPETGWTDCMVIKVPIDDDSFMSYTLNFAALTGEASDRYRVRLAARHWGASQTNDLAAAILRGERHVSEFDDHLEAVAIQDSVAQAGQDRIADRSQDHLGRSDEGVILLRKLWERELRAFDEGRPLKDWYRPVDMRVISGVVEREATPASV